MSQKHVDALLHHELYTTTDEEKTHRTDILDQQNQEDKHKYLDEYIRLHLDKVYHR